MTFDRQLKSGFFAFLESFTLLWKNKTILLYLDITMLLHLVFALAATTSAFGIRTSMVLFFLAQQINQLLIPCAAVACAYHTAQALGKKKISFISGLKGIVPKLERIVFLVVLFELITEFTIISIGGNAGSTFMMLVTLALPLMAFTVATTNRWFLYVITDVWVMVREKFGQLLGSAIPLLAIFYLVVSILARLFFALARHSVSPNLIATIHEAILTIVEASVLTHGIVIVALLFKRNTKRS